MSDLICQKCGSKNPAWYADNDLFNKVNGSPDGVLCPMCFQELADSKGINIIFKAEDMAKDDQSKKPREAYKAALRREIEKQNKDKEFPQMLWTISEILNLIDNVTPKQ